MRKTECLAMILASGQGSRLGALTKRVAKYHGNPTEQVQRALILAGRLHEHKEFGELLLRPLGALLKDALASRLGSPLPGQADPALAAIREVWNTEQLSAKVTAIEKALNALSRIVISPKPV